MLMCAEATADVKVYLIRTVDNLYRGAAEEKLMKIRFEKKIGLPTRLLDLDFFRRIFNLISVKRFKQFLSLPTAGKIQTHGYILFLLKYIG